MRTVETSQLAADLVRALDPVELARAAGLEPDGWQEKFLRSPARRLLLNCARQAGKSTMVAIMAAHTVLFQPGSLVLLLSPSLRQSQELFNVAVLPEWHGLRQVVVDALGPYPEARQAVVRALQSAPDSTMRRLP